MYAKLMNESLFRGSVIPVRLYKFSHSYPRPEEVEIISKKIG